MGNESALQDCEGYTRWGGKAILGGEGKLGWVEREGLTGWEEKARLGGDGGSTPQIL